MSSDIPCVKGVIYEHLVVVADAVADTVADAVADDVVSKPQVEP